MTRAQKNWLALGVIQYCPAAYWRLLPPSWIDIRFINAYGRPKTKRALARWGLGTDDLTRKGNRSIADLQSGQVNGLSEAEFKKSFGEAAPNLKKGIASPSIPLKQFFPRTKQRRHVISPATASEIRKTLGITQAEMRNVLRAFRAAGIRL